MKVVYKYKTTNVPYRANIIHFGIDPSDGEFAVWAETEVGVAIHSYKYLTVLGTGSHVLEDYIHRGSTIQGNTFVWHLYEVL